MYRAEATINICRIVTDVGAAAEFGLIVPANATVKPLGVSGKDQLLPDISGYTDSLDDVHARNGDPVTVYRGGSGSEAENEVLVQCGGTVAYGAPIMAAADGSGKAITATTGKWAVGFAREAGVDGGFIRATVQPFYLGTVS